MAEEEDHSYNLEGLNFEMLKKNTGVFTPYD